MESGRNKRKMGTQEEDDDDDEEEEKVEKFFALIRSTREMRDRLRNVPNIESKKEEEKKKKVQEQTLWNPTFLPEDFVEDSNPSLLNDAAAAAAGPSSKKEEEDHKETKEEGEDCGLDLKLSL